MFDRMEHETRGGGVESKLNSLSAVLVFSSSFQQPSAFSHILSVSRHTAVCS